MKKFIGILLVVILMVSSASMAYADNFGNVNMTATVGTAADIAMTIVNTPEPIIFGTVAAGSYSVAAGTSTITNTSSGIVVTYWLKGFDITDMWTLQASAGADQYALKAVFNAASALSGDFVANDAVQTEAQSTANGVESSDVVYAVDASGYTGANVDPGVARNLYVKFDAPTMVTVPGEASFVLSVLARAASW